MQTTLGDSAPKSLPWLRQVVADCLHIRPEDIAEGVPLASYGLDSLAAVELLAALSCAIGRDLPDWLLLDSPDIGQLERQLMSANESELQTERKRSARLEQMRADCILPPDIDPSPTQPAVHTEQTVLLTGATGFVGIHLLDTLLKRSGARIVCLVRPDPSLDGKLRIRRAMEAYGLDAEELQNRVEVVIGDLSRPRLGLSEATFDSLCGRIDRIYHAAAYVNWVQPYEALRSANVMGTLEVLRLASRRRPKPLHYLSTIGVCLAHPGPQRVAEDDDMSEHIAGLHFGYVQSKCVAETLVRKAAKRGLPATVCRPSLISGHSHTGRSDTRAFLSKFLKGCIQMGCAPDLDWILDPCPVDYVAASIVQLSMAREQSLCAWHLVNPHVTHWRECVLWINLYGYSLDLIPYREWLQHLQTDASDPRHALHSLRTFFVGRLPQLGGLTLPELFEEDRKARVASEQTRKRLAHLAVDCPPLDASLLDRYFASFIDSGFLEPPIEPSKPSRPKTSQRCKTADITTILRRALQHESVEIRTVDEPASSCRNSIITELSSWMFGRARGLSRHRVDMFLDDHAGLESLEVMVKQKPEDLEVIQIGQSVADLCGTELARAYSRNKHRIGLDACHLKELAIYGQSDWRFRMHSPVCYGSLRRDNESAWILLLEYLSDTVLMDSADDVSGWDQEHIEAAIHGLAKLHSIWWNREGELVQQPWLGSTFSTTTMAEMSDLWRALADYAAPLFEDWIGPSIRRLQRKLVADVDRWWRVLDSSPRTLIHNDFNPRNITFRRKDSGLRLCAYDWELATLGVPQHDLAELLCFVLSPQNSRDEVEHYLELHRGELERLTGCPIDIDSWRLGFQASLCDLLLNRFAMYSMIHTFRSQVFLRRVVQTWRTVHEHSTGSRC